MTSSDPIIDAVFREYTELELRHHQLLQVRKEDSVEIAEAEDRMNLLWPKLDDVQRQSLRGMASDLNWIRRNGQLPPKGRKTPEEVSAAELWELSAAMNSKKWHRILHYLRLCGPVFQTASLARERGIAYDAIGFPNYARAFNEKVVEFVGTTSVVGATEFERIPPTTVEARAIESAAASKVLVREPNGVRATGATEDRILGQVKYKPYAA